MSLGKPSSIYIQALLACSSPVVLMCLVLLLAAMRPTKQGRWKAGAIRCAGVFSFVSSGHYPFQSLYTWHEDFIIFAELCTAEGSAQILYLLALCSKILSFGGKLFFRLVQSLHIFVRYSPEPHWKLKWLFACFPKLVAIHLLQLQGLRQLPHRVSVIFKYWYFH